MRRNSLSSLQKTSDQRTFITFCISCRWSRLLWISIYISIIIKAKARYYIERIACYKRCGFFIVSAWIMLSCDWHWLINLLSLKLYFSILLSSTWSVSQEVITAWRTHLNEKLFMKKSAIAVLIFHKNCVPNLYIRLSCIKLCCFFLFVCLKREKTNGTVGKIAKTTYREKL